jgi:hypothetical protein
MLRPGDFRTTGRGSRQVREALFQQTHEDGTIMGLPQNDIDATG